ncbi:MAG: multidrug efflux RND transporter permease subunit [Deltaproteobacteria bacterium]|nr:multidrug efflux RND transporter permease subunit [Deltaproteobacteria bacterium]
MMLARFFVDRPIFATVLSLVIIIIGGVSLFRLPVAQYPEVAPPTVEVTAFYPGANAKVVAETVATPIEQEVNGVERMRYMESRSTNDGRMVLTVTFELGTNLDTAQVLVQNRVAIAEPKLPEEARRQGVVTKKTSPSLLMVVGLISPNNRYDTLYLSNYAILQVKDALARVPGVGEALLFDSREYSMRIWLDPEKLASRDMTASDVTRALREQNVQVAAGGLGQQPVPTGQDFQYTINTLGRLIEEDQFADIIIKTGVGGQMTRLRDVSHVELGARSYAVRSYLNEQPIISIGIFELPGSNALETAYGIKAEMERLKSRFPDGVDYRIVYDTTAYIEDSINSVYRTLFEAVILVFIVVLLFLQDWRITLLPMIDVPVSLIGTFAVMAALGFSLNNLSLFGLVLAIGIVVDDSIVVVENIERWMAKGLAPREATLKAMEEITGPVIAITLVLSAVFIPTAFVAGISGQFYRQFALTIAASTLISAINALTMTPARAVQFIRAHDATHDDREPLPRIGIALLFGVLAYVWLTPHVSAVIGTSLLTQSSGLLATWLVPGLVFIIGSVVGWLLGPGVNWLLRKVFAGFDWAFEKLTIGYGYGVALFLRLSVIVLLLYGGLIGVTYLGFTRIPTGFIPEQDKGYIVVAAQLPDGANLERSDAVMKRASEIARAIPGVAHAVSIPGFSLLTGTNLSNAGTMFVILDPSAERAGRPGLQASDILSQMRGGFWEIQDAFVLAFGAPPVEGIGNTGGFKMQIQDRGSSTPAALQAVVDSVLQTGNAQPGLVGLFSTYRASEPQLYVDVDRAKAKAQGIALSDLFDTLQVYLGSAYINDFTRFGRNWQVYAQADAPFRMRTEDIGQLKVRNAAGQMVPLGTLTHIESMGGPSVVSHYNMFPSAAINGSLLPGTSSGQAITMMEHVAWQELPSSMGFEWTELTLEEITAGNTAIFVFALGTLFVFLVLAALYESWSLPLAIILIVPMCLFAAMAGVWIVGSDNNIFTQIGLVVLIGLAAKNAILIVEFAKQREEEGQERRAAIIEACRLRLRPILMTSFAFIFGVLPLLISQGAGAEMRFALGITVFSGMLGVTLFGIFFTPVFYWVIRRLTNKT